MAVKKECINFVNAYWLAMQHYIFVAHD